MIFDRSFQFQKYVIFIYSLIMIILCITFSIMILAEPVRYIEECKQNDTLPRNYSYQFDEKQFYVKGNQTSFVFNVTETNKTHHENGTNGTNGTDCKKSLSSKDIVYKVFMVLLLLIAGIF